MSDESSAAATERTSPLEALFNPSSVAIVGASDHPAKWGHALATQALEGEGRRRVYLTNRRGGSVLGRHAYRSLAELPETPEAVFLSVPSASFEQEVNAALEARTRVIVGITSGFAEVGGAGRALERTVVRRVRQHGARLLGPNCSGVFDAGANLSIGMSDIPSGRIALISQSGNLALEMARLAHARGVGFSRIVSLGNQGDISATEVLEIMATHAGTDVLVLYIEEFTTGRSFARLAHRVVTAGKPIVLLSTGDSTAGQRAAASHTGALVSGSVAVEALCRSAGIERVATPTQAIECAQVLLNGTVRCPGRRVAVMADGGGHGGIAADLLVAAGLEVPRLSSAVSAELAAKLPLTSGLSNPIDLVGAEQDLTVYGSIAQSLVFSGEVDAILLTGYFGGYGGRSADFQRLETSAAESLCRVARESKTAVVAHTMNWASTSAGVLRSGGVPVFDSIEGAVRALVVGTRATRAGSFGMPPPMKRSTQHQPAPAVSSYWTARTMLAAYGVPFARARRVCDALGAARAAKHLGYPVVLKNVEHAHKSDQGSVLLNISDEVELRRAVDQLSFGARSCDLSVEELAPVASGIELIVGARRDRSFGPLVVVGIGGIYTEVFRDVAVALAPVTAEQARALLASLRAAALFGALRGRPPLDVASAAQVIVAVGRAIASSAGISEIEVNPLLVTSDGVIGLDALLALRYRPPTDGLASGKRAKRVTSPDVLNQ